MITLPKTHNALNDLPSKVSLFSGVNVNWDKTTTSKGMVMRERLRDDMRDRHVLPPPYSIWNMITGEEYVKERRPRNSMNVSVFIQRDYADRYDPEFITAAKREMEGCLVQSLYEINADLGNRMFLYGLGDTEDMTNVYHGLEVIPDKDMQPDKISKICLLGLGIFIGGAKELPLPKLLLHGSPAVMLLTRHILEDEVSLELNSFTTGIRDYPRVNTRDSQQTQDYNAYLRLNFAAKIKSLQNSGIQVAISTFDKPHNPITGFNYASTDESLSRAINQLRPQY